MGSWFTPSNPSELTIQVVGKTGASYQLHSQLEFTLTDDAIALVDAGVPLQVKYVFHTDSETSVLIRTLRSDLGSRSYTVSDSTGNRVSSTKKVGNVILAARQFKGVTWQIDVTDSKIELSAEILSVNVPRLGRTVDISPLFGGKKFTQTIVIDRKDLK